LKAPMCDEASWSAAISQLLGDPARCGEMAKAGAEKLKRDFTKEKWLGRIEGIYNRVLSRNT
ncbi:MAG: glycosyltransferase, partial [Spartobacteria bacterium]